MAQAQGRETPSLREDGEDMGAYMEDGWKKD